MSGFNITVYFVLLEWHGSVSSTQTNIDDVGRKRRYTRNILQWSKNDFKSMIYTNGDYSLNHANSLNITNVLLMRRYKWFEKLQTKKFEVLKSEEN